MTAGACELEEESLEAMSLPCSRVVDEKDVMDALFGKEVVVVVECGEGV